MKQTAKNRMGNRSGVVTRIFNISRKLRLTDPLRLKDGESITSKSVESWIKENPQRVWREVYETGRVELASDAYRMLMQVAQEQFPLIYRQKEQRKAKHRKLAAQNKSNPSEHGS